ncbi:polyprenyl synthetase family protein [[Actinomadura] parvosata]|uniref:polyprenyl synthetase family protein n=1 Tax=[Actinomadura] parvosata TaxID=1955412 RepID=UPI00406C9D33
MTVPMHTHAPLDLVRDRLIGLAASLPAPLRPAAHALLARSGKLLRPRLLLACSRLGAAEADQTVRAAAMVELVHVASLLHDDVIDKAASRRGGPSAHVLAGSEQAVLAGLAVFALAGMEAADLGPGVARATSQAIAAIASGELLDVERAFNTALPIEDYVALVGAKTGLLFQLGCRLGACLALAPAEQVGSVARFGQALGVSFQILDDCLEMNPDHQTGKPTQTDHTLGLFGAPTLYALHADAGGKLARLLMSPAFAPDDMIAVRALVAERGGIDAADQLAQQWHDQAMAALDTLPAGPAKDDLTDIAAALMPGS